MLTSYSPSHSGTARHCSFCFRPVAVRAGLDRVFLTVPLVRWPRRPIAKSMRRGCRMFLFLISCLQSKPRHEATERPQRGGGTHFGGRLRELLAASYMAGKPTATQSRDARKPSSNAGTLGAHVSAQSGVVPASVAPGLVPHAELEVSSEPPPAAALRLRVALMDDVPSATVAVSHNLRIDRCIR